jgi:hypothetical protein
MRAVLCLIAPCSLVEYNDVSEMLAANSTFSHRNCNITVSVIICLWEKLRREIYYRDMHNSPATTTTTNKRWLQNGFKENLKNDCLG